MTVIRNALSRYVGVNLRKALKILLKCVLLRVRKKLLRTVFTPDKRSWSSRMFSSASSSPYVDTERIFCVGNVGLNNYFAELFDIYLV